MSNGLHMSSRESRHGRVGDQQHWELQSSHQLRDMLTADYGWVGDSAGNIPTFLGSGGKRRNVVLACTPGHIASYRGLINLHIIPKHS